MSSAGKTPASTGSKENSRKADKSSPGLITLAVSPEKLRAIFANNTLSKDKGSDSTSVAAASTPAPTKDEDSRAATPSNAPLNATPSSANNDNASESTPNTPSRGAGADANGAEGTPVPQASLAVPEVVTKKKGGKRSAAAAGLDGNSNGPGSVNGEPAPRVRSKPGPKKKTRLEDGMVESGRGGGHKLGPKASMGAINAGLRALDRSGKPCRKWAKGGFRLKTFTGVLWEIPRWKAPPKPTPDATSGGDTTPATTSADGSNKENDSKDKKDGKDVKKESNNKDAAAPNKEAVNGDVKTNGATTNGDSKASIDTPASATVNGDAASSQANGDVEMQSAAPSAQPSPPATTEPAEAPAAPVAASAA